MRESLATIPDGSQDFVIADHFIEHCQDPISALTIHFRVLKTGGILYMAVPDKRFTFDKDRPVTPTSISTRIMRSVRLSRGCSILRIGCASSIR